MRRITLLAAVALVMAAMMAASAMPAFAANPHASCVGQGHSTINQLLPGNPGTFHRLAAHGGYNGELMSSYARLGDPGSPTRQQGAFFYGFDNGTQTGTFAACAA